MRLTLEDLLKLQIAFNHIIEDMLDEKDFKILSKYGFIKYNYINGVQYIQYPNVQEATQILNDINKNLK